MRSRIKLHNAALCAATFGCALLLLGASRLPAEESLGTACELDPDFVCMTLPATPPVCLPDVGCVGGMPETQLKGRQIPQ